VAVRGEANLTALGRAALVMAIGTVPLFIGLIGQERLTDMSVSGWVLGHAGEQGTTPRRAPVGAGGLRGGSV